MSTDLSFVSLERVGDKIVVGARRYAPEPCHELLFDDLLTEEEKLIKANRNTQRSIMRTIRRVGKLAMANDFKYFVTLSFNEKLSSTYGFELVDQFLKWMRCRFYRKGVILKYLLVIVPNEIGQWHIHLLLQDVPDGEFCPLAQCPGQMTQDALAKIEHGAVIYGWKAFKNRFDSLSFIQCIGDMDENLQMIRQDGKVRYMQKQFLGDNSEMDKETLNTKLQFYRDFIPKGKHPYRNSGNLVKPEKLYADVVPREELEQYLEACCMKLGPMGTAGEIDLATGEELLALLRLRKS